MQLLADRIQNVENNVPIATIRAAKKCAHVGTSLRPTNRTPRKPASRKKAVKPSYANSGERTSPAADAYRLQLVPNWNGMMRPVTTPMPNAMAKILVQNTELRA